MYASRGYFVNFTQLRRPILTYVPIKTLVIDGNFRVEDRGLKTLQGLMAAFNIQETLIWKEKIEYVIDQLLMGINTSHLNINLEWIVEEMLPLQINKVGIVLLKMKIQNQAYSKEQQLGMVIVFLLCLIYGSID
ncbi:hypothetical protein L2E82_44065 [Cichorium intybus]|uniref:Uncharacterized protein n=1 Tax=Cichorium intybus TaxID=13427 RepID=A0ACB8ZQQ3_CICIN|nr:hypothetical protein L2E82_44065 [Cichorium intybus]